MQRPGHTGRKALATKKRPQTRMLATHPHKIFAAPIGTASPNNIYTLHGPKSACQQPIHTNFRSSYWHSTQTQFTHSNKSHGCHVKAAAERRSPKRAKAYIRPRAGNTSHARHAKANRRAAETKKRQRLHQTPHQCSKFHACHAKATAERRRPKRVKA